MSYPVIKPSGPELNDRIKSSSQYKDGKFTNQQATKMAANPLKAAWRFIFDKAEQSVPKKPIPVNNVSQSNLLAGGDVIYRLGHSTVLMKFGSEIWLTDPVFSKRVSPYSWVGPARFHQPPIRLEDLPDITGVIISHNHYDHLDKETIIKIKDKVAHFVVPLGVGEQLRKWGVVEQKITELDWWQSITIADTRVISTPAQHFSGRGLFDSDKSLWSSWVIKHANKKIFFSGDSGYFAGFKEIGDKLGPFDITLMETGAYDESWSDIHMLPEQTVQAHIDLKGEYLMPIHNSTFDLALHNWFEPLERVAASAKEQGVQLLTPEIGQPVNIESPRATDQWWQRLYSINQENVVGQLE